MLVTLSLSASTTTTTESRPISSENTIRLRNPSNDTSMSSSLRRDIDSHPEDFVAFDTESAADQFIAKHEDEIDRETDHRVILRGILGYWRGKTLVILSRLPTPTLR